MDPLEDVQAEDGDRRLLARLRARDVEALGELQRIHGARVYRLCRGLLAQPSDAEDATQEILLKVFERAERFAGRARFSTWLHRLTVNHCLNRLERERLRRADVLDQGLDDGRLRDPAPAPPEDAGAADERLLVERLLSRLPPDQRAVLTLRELEELSYGEIAAVLRIPVGTVMSRLARARARLRAVLGELPSRPHAPPPHRLAPLRIPCPPQPSSSAPESRAPPRIQPRNP